MNFFVVFLDKLEQMLFHLSHKNHNSGLVLFLIWFGLIGFVLICFLFGSILVDYDQ